MLLGFVIVMTDGSGDSSDISFAAALFPVLLVVLFVLRLGLRHAFNQRYSGEVERRWVLEHSGAARL